MKAVLDLPASLLRKARAAARQRGITVEKLAARGFRLAIEEPPKFVRLRKLTKAERALLRASEEEITAQFRAFPTVDKRPVAEIVSSMRR
jgi:hypothetical protein